MQRSGPTFDLQATGQNSFIAATGGDAILPLVPAASGALYLDEWEGKNGKQYTLTMDARDVEKQWDRKNGDDAPADREPARRNNNDDIPF